MVENINSPILFFMFILCALFACWNSAVLKFASLGQVFRFASHYGIPLSNCVARRPGTVTHKVRQAPRLPDLCFTHLGVIIMTLSWKFLIARSLDSISEFCVLQNSCISPVARFTELHSLRSLRPSEFPLHHSHSAHA